MNIILDDLKETKEMMEYEKETGKKAIWRGNVTEGFKKWQKGEKVYEKNKESQSCPQRKTTLRVPGTPYLIKAILSFRNQ